MSLYPHDYEPSDENEWMNYFNNNIHEYPPPFPPTPIYVPSNSPPPAQHGPNQASPPPHGYVPTSVFQDLWFNYLYFKDVAAWYQREYELRHYRDFVTKVRDFMKYLHEMAPHLAFGIETYLPYLKNWYFQRPRFRDHLYHNTHFRPFRAWLRTRYPIPHQD